MFKSKMKLRKRFIKPTGHYWGHYTLFHSVGPYLLHTLNFVLHTSSFCTAHTIPLPPKSYPIDGRLVQMGTQRVRLQAVGETHSDGSRHILSARPLLRRLTTTTCTSFPLRTGPHGLPAKSIGRTTRSTELLQRSPIVREQDADAGSTSLFLSHDLRPNAIVVVIA